MAHAIRRRPPALRRGRRVRTRDRARGAVRPTDVGMLL